MHLHLAVAAVVVLAVLVLQAHLAARFRTHRAVRAQHLLSQAHRSHVRVVAVVDTKTKAVLFLRAAQVAAVMAQQVRWQQQAAQQTQAAAVVAAVRLAATAVQVSSSSKSPIPTAHSFRLA